MKDAAAYTVVHETHYDYTTPVSQSWQLARLTPRVLPWQSLQSHAVRIEPGADERRDEVDSFGNTVTHFALHGGHRQLDVTMECRVTVGERPVPGSISILTRQTTADLPVATPNRPADAWENVRESIRRDPAQDDLVPAGMSESTPLLPLSEAARLYASASFGRGRPWFDAVFELMGRIHRDFEFEPGATTVSTSVDEVLQRRHGVCQDFAHLMLACLRGHGLPARYVSGYLLTDPPPGMPRLMGVDASHAWIAAYSPQHGWIEFDPTNDQLADRRYITLTWGADFADVVPLRGVIFGGGEQLMDVRVSVIPD